ncbi:protein kinase [Polynucleobacter sp. MWH-Spelu-300-X4]|uniref:bifunctional serine/threonine-protein kinase/universal stress protein n=1 Tax=Polynucleobacter sp. MWH-Spelu-300-X4 TaxID=2689109 RepID=UPI001BFE5C8D|nr:bifunctional serine/threonine-protein kinase/universal stress protein [Polynucleobacter sp. MWH-Spelu-300-X4]QWD80203.1 protein kinase [Polynucleobacter sp. MWH-Spelu-300-X4]
MAINKQIESINEIFQEGKEIDGFLIGQEVHRGGMAVLYEATKEGVLYPILLKVPRVGRDQPVESLIGFETELTIMKALKSPYVPRLAGAGNMARKPYIAMERLEGRPLTELLEEQGGRLEDISQVVEIVANISLAVASLHAQDVIHLDLKPENILIGKDNKIALIDFGLAHHMRYPDLLVEQMRKGVGSAPYISPEQVMGMRNDWRSDIFAIGAILYEMLTGEFPFGAPSTIGGLRKRMWMEPLPPRAIRKEIPLWLQEVVLRCLEPLASNRYQSSTRLRQLLRAPEGVQLTERAEKLYPNSAWQNMKRWFRAAGYEPSPCPKPSIAQDNAPLIIAAIDTRQNDEVLRQRMQSTAKHLLQAYPESRLICLSTISSTPTFEGSNEDETASGIVRGHLVQLMDWAKPLQMPTERLSFHVLEAMDPASRIVEFAEDNQASMILIGASHKIPTKVTPWRTSMTKIVEEAPCSVHIVRS